MQGMISWLALLKEWLNNDKALLSWLDQLIGGFKYQPQALLTHAIGSIVFEVGLGSRWAQLSSSTDNVDDDVCG
jgi:hypothetical protein